MVKKNYVPTVQEVLDKPNQFISEFKELNTQTITELNRFKQDCRKRAMELAHNEYSDLIRVSGAEKGGEFNVLETADKYYTWLTKEV